MAVSIAATVDNNTVIITVLPEDDHGDATPDQLTWANDDTASAVAAWAVDATTHVYTGTLTHAEGTVNITATDPSASGLAPFEAQLVVGPGGTSQLVGTAVVS
jgi:hypothetical protein